MVEIVESLLGLPGGSISAFVIVFALLTIGFSILLRIALKILSYLVGKTKTALDDKVLKSIKRYFLPIAIFTAAWLAFELVYSEAVVFGVMNASDVYFVIMLAIGGFMLSSLANVFLIWYGMELRPDNRKVREEEIFPFVRNVIRIAIILIFSVFILQKLGFETSAIITGLGVGGIAVALALQDTLGNFFGGVHILVDKPFREEDYIKLDPGSSSGVEGTVKQIGWRTTRIITPAQNEVVVPNSKLASSVLENYHAPSEWTGIGYGIGVGYDEDVDEVVKTIEKTIRKIGEKNENMDLQSVWVRFDSFGEYSLNFKFGYLVKGYMNRWKISNDINTELLASFRKKNIEIPFPVRVIYERNGRVNRQKKK